MIEQDNTKILNSEELGEDLGEWGQDFTYFGEFLKRVEQLELTTNTTSKGEITIQQTPRNELRREGLNWLKRDLNELYGIDGFDVVETKEGLIIVAENEPTGYTFSWELKSTIKSLNFDPFLEAGNFDEEQTRKTQLKNKRRAEAEAKAERLAAKRAAALAKLGEVE